MNLVKCGLAAVMALGALAASLPAEAARHGDRDERGGKTRVGTLTCNVSGGVGLIVTSKRRLSCVFEGSHGRREFYTGSVRKYGLDVGVTSRGTMVWGVIAPSNDFRPGALAGDYVGAQGSASVGVGGGANLLVGGSDRSFSLQPLSVEGSKGINLALGVAGLSLDYSRRR